MSNLLGTPRTFPDTPPETAKISSGFKGTPVFGSTSIDFIKFHLLECERQDLNLCTPVGTSFEPVAFDHSATFAYKDYMMTTLLFLPRKIVVNPQHVSEKVYNVSNKYPTSPCSGSCPTNPQDIAEKVNTKPVEPKLLVRLGYEKSANSGDQGGQKLQGAAKPPY